MQWYVLRIFTAACFKRSIQTNMGQGRQVGVGSRFDFPESAKPQQQICLMSSKLYGLLRAFTTHTLSFKDSRKSEGHQITRLPTSSEGHPLGANEGSVGLTVVVCGLFVTMLPDASLPAWFG